ncbi:MAG TPA: hypothetical protein VGE63_00700 [Candidatus Paceibacterota bacterium]
MKNKKKSVAQRVSLLVTVIASICGAVYVLYVGRSLILPPKVIFENIKDGTAFEYPLVILEGSTKRTQSIQINGYPITLSPEGTFQHDILLSPGNNTLIIDLQDPFSMQKRRILRLYCRFPCQPYISPSVTKKSDTPAIDAQTKSEDTIDITNTDSEATPSLTPVN